MKLVYDADHIENPEEIIYASVSDELRQLAAAIDRGEWGEVVSGVILIENANGIHTVGIGEQATAYEMMGMFEAAKLKVFAEDFCED
jgi:hypothetical protein